MLSPFHQRLLRSLCRLYGVMLRAYPLDFRREYSREMMLVFQSHLRDVVENSGGWALLPLSLNILGDWLVTVWSQGDDMETIRKALVAAVRDICCITVGASCFVVAAYTLFGRDPKYPAIAVVAPCVRANAGIDVCRARHRYATRCQRCSVGSWHGRGGGPWCLKGLMWLSGSMVIRPVSYYAFDVGAVGVLQGALTVALFSWRFLKG